MELIAGLPFWEAVFDADGDPSGPSRDALPAGVRERGITDLVVFAHGWNTDPAGARRLYEAFFGLLAGQLHHVPAGRPVTVGLAGVVWPAQRWSDEPIPDFTAAAPVPAARVGGAASLGAGSAEPPQQPATRGVDEQQLAQLRALFPKATTQLDTMAALLDGPSTPAAMDAFHAALADFAATVAVPSTDGEDDDAAPPPQPGAPRMLRDDATELFSRYRAALVRSGAELDGGGGQAGLGDALGGLFHGAKEALRQATYWQMKNRAGVVGQRGLGPLLGALDAARVRVHLVGHSFGARLVSFALAGLPPGPSPVRSVTLLQGAFSHYAFADPMPFDAGRRGALAGMLPRINGPLVACFSEHDAAVGTFYPLASFAAQSDSAAVNDALFRWGGMGANGAQAVGAPLDAIQPAGPGAAYRFGVGRALNVDASQVVRTGGPPSGAHSDIVHPELTWIVLSAGGIV
jgi:hypothetical protein